MSEVKDYVTSMEIESWLKTVLNVKPMSRADKFLKGSYEYMVNYEKGMVYGITPSQHKKHIKTFLGYFEKAMDKLEKKSAANRVEITLHRGRLSYINNSEGVLNLFRALEPLHS